MSDQLEPKQGKETKEKKVAAATETTLSDCVMSCIGSVISKYNNDADPDVIAERAIALGKALHKRINKG